MKNRKKLYIDPVVQGFVIRRIATYWAVCVLFLTLPMLIVETLLDPSKMFFSHLGPLMARMWPAYAALAFLLPFLMMDALKVTNRLAGPMYRIRNELERLAKGEKIRRINLRKGDFFQSVADQVGAVAERYEKVM